MTVTFIGVKSIATLPAVGPEADRLQPCLGRGLRCRAWRFGAWRERVFSGKHFSQRPINPASSFLNNSYLLCLFFQIRRIDDRLERIADMVIHLRNYAHFFKNQLVLVALIGEYQDSGKNADQQIIDHSGHAADTQFVQQRP